METTFPVSITPRALAQVQRLLAKDGRSEAFLRLGVKGGGCSGFEYVMKIDTVRRPIDIVLEADGVTVVCDSKSARFLDGSTFDYTGNLIGVVNFPPKQIGPFRSECLVCGFDRAPGEVVLAQPASQVPNGSRLY